MDHLAAHFENAARRLAFQLYYERIEAFELDGVTTTWEGLSPEAQNLYITAAKQTLHSIRLMETPTFLALAQSMDLRTTAKVIGSIGEAR